MGGKTATSTQAVSIPPSVLAQYQSVNSQAEQTAQTPFQTYGGQFVAPVNAEQQTGISGVNADANLAQPYYANAQTGLGAAQAGTQPYNAAAAGQIQGAQAATQPINNAAVGTIASADANTQPYNAAAAGQIQSAQAGTQPLNNASAGTLGSAQAGTAGMNNLATGLAAGSAEQVNPSSLDSASIDKYLSPYLNTVLGSESALLNQNNQQQQSGQLGTAIQSGAFGGDRTGLAAANLEQQQNLANSSIYSNILNTGYNNALSTAQQQQGVGLAAGQANRAALGSAGQEIAGIGQTQYGEGAQTAAQLAALGQTQYGEGAQTATTEAGLGQTAFGEGAQTASTLASLGQTAYGEGANTATTEAGLGQTAYGEGAATSAAEAQLGAGAQASALSGAQAQIGAGTVQQQTQQAQDTALYNQFLQQQSYPFQVDQFLANIAEGTGALSGSTTTTQQPGGFFSDRRLKYDLRKIGKTYDGQDLYSYKMHGDPRTHVGLIAQDVEKKHPHAVGLAAGWKTVDYGKATEKAANRGHFNAGGVAGGGRVWRPAAYAMGGSPSIVDNNDLQAILAAQNGMYAPMSGGAGMYGGSGTGVPRGGSSRVPPPSGAVPHLVSVAGGLKAQPTGMENAKNWADTAKSATDLYKSFNQSHPSQQTQSTAPAGPAPADTPGDNRARGGGVVALRPRYDTGGSADGSTLGAILAAQQRMYQEQHPNRDVPAQSNGTHQLAVANGSPAPPPSGSSNVNNAIGLGQKGYSAYKHFNPSTTPKSGNSGAPTSGDISNSTTGSTTGSNSLSGAGVDAGAAPNMPPIEGADAGAAADTAAPAASGAASGVAAPAAAEVAAPAAADAAGTVVAGGAADAGAADAAAALAAEYAAADAAVVVAAAKRGGAIRRKFEAGGTPYEATPEGSPYADDGGQIGIPDTQNSTKLQTAGPLKKQPTGLQTLETLGTQEGAQSAIGGMFSNSALARGGEVERRKGYDTGGSPDDGDPDADPDMINPQGVAKGVINRSRKPEGLMYSRDAGSPIPYAAPKAPATQRAVDPDVAAYTAGNYGPLADSAWTPPSAPLTARGSSGSWGNDNPTLGIKSANAATPPPKPRPAAPATTGLAAGAADEGPPSNLQGGNPTYTGGVSPIPVSAPDPQTPAQVPVDKQSWFDKIKSGPLGKPENLIPLLTAIGAMGTAPTRSLGVAASSGLLAGAQSYMPTQQALADVKQTGATTELTGAETGGQNVHNIAELQQQYALKGFALYPDPNGPIQGPDGRRYMAKPKTASMGAAPPTSAPPQYNYLGKNGVQTAQGEGVRYSMLPDESQGASQKQIDDIYQSGHASQQNMLNIQRWEQSMAANKGHLDGGAFNDLRVKAANLWDTMMDNTGHPEYKVAGLPEAQIAAKVSTGAAAMNENEHQQRSFGALKAFLAATPNPEMQKEAALPLIADLHTENQMAIDRKNYLDEFDKENQRAFGAPVPRNYLAADALQSFDKDYPSNNYQGERNNLATIMQSQGFAKLSGDLQNATPEKKQKIYAALDAKYGPNFHRYFTGS